jgi:excisionase family DNA binding protein
MLSELIDEIEERLRLIVKEEVKNALLEANNPSAGIMIQPKPETVKPQETIKPVVNKDFPTLLRAKDAAKILGVNVARVYELARERKANGFPVIVLGERQYRFSKEAILTWINRDNQ